MVCGILGDTSTFEALTVCLGQSHILCYATLDYGMMELICGNCKEDPKIQ